MNSAPANEAELYFERGGPTQRFVERLARKWNLGYSTGLRILCFLAFTWLPLAALALIEGRGLATSPKDSFLLDFATYARFFLAVPLLLIAESVVGPRLRSAGLQFIEGGFIRDEDQAAFDSAIARVARWRESGWAELMILGIAMMGAWGFTAETIYGEGLATWRSITRATSDGTTLSLTGLWYRCVALPILQFFWYRWLWRLFVWTRFLWTVSRLNLNLVASHADRAGGLGFLGTAHAGLGIFAFSLSSVLSAEAASLMVFHNADIRTFQPHFLAIAAIIQLVFLGPLLMFAPLLMRNRQAWLRDYSLLVTRYNRAFDSKWIRGNITQNDLLLGTSDIQSLADLGNSFEFIRRMKAVPFSRVVVVQLAMATSIPCLPLFLLIMPLSDVFDLLIKAVF